MYFPVTGQFLSRDAWQGDYNRSLSLNRWAYVEGNPINYVDPTGYCEQSGWDDQNGLFTEANCARLESGDLEFTEEWYYAFADYIQTDLPQTAANMRHFLDGSGSEFHLQNTFMQNRIYGWPKLRRSVERLVVWYIRSNLEQANGCAIEVGPDIFASAFTPPYYQAWKYWPGDKSQLDISGSLGTFRLDVEIQGTLDNYQDQFFSNKVNPDLTIHLVVLDYYNWHGGLGVSYEGNSIEDEWADDLAEAGMARPFLVRGDLDINYSTLVNSQLFGIPVGAEPPGDWVRASCIGSQFDIDQEGPGQIDYCGNPMR